MSHLHFLTFGDGSTGYRAAVRRLIKQASDAQLFKSKKGYTLDELRAEFPDFWRNHGAFIAAHPRGLGYWLWKPFLIREALSNLPDGDFLIYADAGCEFIEDSSGDIAGLLPTEANQDVAVYRIDSQLIRQWTNLTTLKRIDGASGCAHLPIIVAGLLFFKNSATSRELVGRWFELAALDDGALIIDRPGEFERTDFIEHRHDQSLLSILVCIFSQSGSLGVKFLDSATTQGEKASSPIRPSRNQTGVSKFSTQRTKFQNASLFLQRLSVGLRRRLRSLVGEKNVGALDFHLRRFRRSGVGTGAFNGQAKRRLIYDAIDRLQQPSLIVECGAGRGETTEVLAMRGVSVVSIESQQRSYGFAAARFRRRSNVSVHLGGSRQSLRELLWESGPAGHPGRLFAYLHEDGFADLSLGDEIDTLFSWDSDAIVMVDNFRVPDDAGYVYSNHPGAVRDKENVAPFVRRLGLVGLYPTSPSSHECGARRGCTILTTNRWKAKLLSTGLLKESEQNALPNFTDLPPPLESSERQFKGWP